MSPTANLDPATADEIRDLIRKLNREGATVFLTTHYMEEAAQADAVTVIGDGAVLEQAPRGS